MASHCLLYTVTGGREVFYAAVDRDNDRVWTSPTKEGAQRQAQDEGFDNFTERVISKDALMESLGVSPDRNLRIRREEHDAHAPKEPSPKSPTSWFVGGVGNEIESTGQKPPFLPRRLKGPKKRPKKGTSPFAGQPIAPPSADGGDDDVLTSFSESEHPPDPHSFDEGAS